MAMEQAGFEELVSVVLRGAQCDGAADCSGSSDVSGGDHDTQRREG
jgi:hypothetical protein